MIDLEIPLGKRTVKYRLLELVPAFISYGMLVLMVVLSMINPTIAAIYLFIVIASLLVKAVGIAARTIQGRSRLEGAKKIDWHQRVLDLEAPAESYERHKNNHSKGFGAHEHIENLRLMTADPSAFPKPSDLYNAVIIATQNESYEILAVTLKAIINGSFDSNRIILVLAYEERGGQDKKESSIRLKQDFGDNFFDFLLVEHPDDLPNEVRGKGPNLTHAGRHLSKWLSEKNIPSKNVIVTSQDADNRPSHVYLDYLTYEYIVHEDRKHLAFQPICMFTSNIWDVPAPMRVIATGNSFWNIISSMRPHTLRNFASHAQPMEALEEMDFWSTKTIVEDGHQYWRSYFYFAGNYSVMPIYAAFYQDAVLSDTYWKTLKAQFIQLRRWAYGASDIPYVANRIFSKNRNVPLFDGMAKLLRLVDGHITLASVSILVMLGGWVPLLVNAEATRSVSANMLPDIVSNVMMVAMVGLVITVFMSFKLLPPRPERYKRSKNLLMVLQWVLMPFTSVIYSSGAALYSQGRLFLGRYLEKFDITDKVTKG